INLTSSSYDENSPSWSSDGKYLLFSRAGYMCNEAVDYWNIYITNLHGSEQKVLPNVGTWTSVAWSPVPSLEQGRQYSITELGANLNLRTEHSLNEKILKKLPTGETITVLEGPIDSDDYYWWKIRTQDGNEGWVVEMAYWYKPLNE